MNNIFDALWELKLQDDARRKVVILERLEDKTFSPRDALDEIAPYLPDATTMTTQPIPAQLWPVPGTGFYLMEVSV